MNTHANGWFHITDPQGWITVRGEDAFRFLQGQFSNDLRSDAPGSITYGLWLNRKGRIEADGFVLENNREDYRIFSAECAGDAIALSLERFIVADDVAIERSSEELRCCSVQGCAVLADCGVVEPTPGRFVHVDGCYVFPGRRARNEQWEIVGPRARIEAIGTRLRRNAFIELDCNSATAIRIRAGIPAIPRDVADGLLPQEAGLDQEAVSFQKGCFLGQEIVAKVRKSGGFRRCLFQVSGDGPVPSGDDVILQQSGKDVGRLCSRASIENGWIGIAVIRFREIDRDRPVTIRNSNCQVFLNAPLADIDAPRSQDPRK